MQVGARIHLPPEAPTSTAGMTAEQILAQAGRRSLPAGEDASLRLYLTALDMGADAALVREGISSLRMARVPSLRQALASMRRESQRSLMAAAGIEPEQAEQTREPAAEARQSYEKALAHAEAERYADALTAFAAAEESGYHASATRDGMARAHEGLGDAISEQAVIDEAAKNYRWAVAFYFDASPSAFGIDESADGGWTFEFDP